MDGSDGGGAIADVRLEGDAVEGVNVRGVVITDEAWGIEEEIAELPEDVEQRKCFGNEALRLNVGLMFESLQAGEDEADPGEVGDAACEQDATMSAQQQESGWPR
jgi:hypothetical protein